MNKIDTMTYKSLGQQRLYEATWRYRQMLDAYSVELRELLDSLPNAMTGLLGEIHEVLAVFCDGPACDCPCAKERR